MSSLIRPPGSLLVWDENSWEREREAEGGHGQTSSPSSVNRTAARQHNKHWAQREREHSYKVTQFYQLFSSQSNGLGPEYDVAASAIKTCLIYPTADHNKWNENCYKVNSKNNFFQLIFIKSSLFINETEHLKILQHQSIQTFMLFLMVSNIFVSSNS